MKKTLIKRYSSLSLSLNKRRKFIIIVIFLSAGIFFSENLFGKFGLLVSVLLSIATNLLFYWSVKSDIKDNFSKHVLILPFFFSLAFGLFYFLTPERQLSRIILTSLYAIGLYSLFLSQNIFLVASIRTIALLSSARIVSLVITLLSFFFLANIVFSLHLFLVYSVLLLFLFSFFLVLQSLWTVTLEKSLKAQWDWALILSFCLLEVATVLWFWPSSPTIIALVLSGFFYVLLGPSQIWLQRRLFKGVLWEYLWVFLIVVFLLVTFTSWGK